MVRRSAVAWGISSSHEETILKNELLDAAYLVMLPFNQHGNSLKKTIYNALNLEDSSISFPFVSFVNVFHKYAIFSSIMK